MPIDHQQLPRNTAPLHLGHVFHLNIRLPEAKEVNDQECAYFRHILEA
ncbi:MAG: hypothetical protein K2O18_19880 [Oscillospiraceae bacterium]|nr:hypothetical protein [Oscillospiraceae bacterium]